MGFKKTKTAEGGESSKQTTMRCPNCGRKAPVSAASCKGCGYDYELQGRPSDEDSKRNQMQQKRDRQMKIIFIAVVSVAVIILIIYIFVSIAAAEGRKKADEIAEHLGGSIDSLSSVTTLYQSSSFTCVNSLTEFNWLCQSDKQISVGGLTVPKWVVFCCNNDQKALTKVIFYNFKILEDNWKGEKIGEKLSADAFYNGMTYDAASELIDLEPYSITYTAANKYYHYRCHYINLEKNEVCQEIELKCDNFGAVNTIDIDEYTYSPIILDGQTDYSETAETTAPVPAVTTAPVTVTGNETTSVTEKQ